MVTCFRGANEEFVIVFTSVKLSLLTRCAILVQKHTLCRVFSGLVQTYQPPKGKKCEILNLELGRVLQRNGYKAVGHKLWGKTRIVVNFYTERLQLNHRRFWCLTYESKKMMRERIDLFVFSLVRTLS